MKAVLVGTSFLLWATVALAQDADLLLDEKTGQPTARGLAASSVAAARVSEMRCRKTGQIAAMLQKVEDELNVQLDMNDKGDFSSVLFFATKIMDGVGKTEGGWSAWCKKYDASFARLFAK